MVKKANSRYCPFNIAEVGLNRVAKNPVQFVKYCTLAMFFCELPTSMYMARMKLLLWSSNKASRNTLCLAVVVWPSLMFSLKHEFRRL